MSQIRQQNEPLHKISPCICSHLGCGSISQNYILETIAKGSSETRVCIRTAKNTLAAIVWIIKRQRLIWGMFSAWAPSLWVGAVSDLRGNIPGHFGRAVHMTLGQ